MTATLDVVSNSTTQIEVTPKAIRLRKRALGMQDREKLRRATKRSAAEMM